MKKIMTIALISVAITALACGPGGGTNGNGAKVPDGEGGARVGLILVVKASRVDKIGVHVPTTRRVRVVIDATDQFGGKGLWIDTPQNGPPAPRPYPKDTQEVTPYEHPILVEPGLIVSVSATVTLLGQRGEFIECHFTDEHGNELTTTYAMAEVRAGPNGRGAAQVHCLTSFEG